MPFCTETWKHEYRFYITGFWGPLEKKLLQHHYLFSLFSWKKAYSFIWSNLKVLSLWCGYFGWVVLYTLHKIKVYTEELAADRCLKNRIFKLIYVFSSSELKQRERREDTGKIFWWNKSKLRRSYHFQQIFHLPH